MLSYALAHLFGCSLGETTTACTKYGHCETGTVTMYISADAMISNFRNLKGYKIDLLPGSLAQEQNIKIVGSAKGGMMVEGLNCAWVYLGHSTAKKKVLGSLLHITLP